MSGTIVSCSYVSSQQHYYYACFAKKEIKAQNSSGTCPGHTASEQQNRGSKAGGVVPKALLYMLLCVTSSPPSTELWVAGTEQRHRLCLQCNASAQIQAGLSRLQLENAINSLCWIAMSSRESDFEDLKICLVAGGTTISEEIHRLWWTCIAL